jgi:hypothetical protein
MSDKQWVCTGTEYAFAELPVITPELPKGVYELGFDSFKKCFVLERIAGKFELPKKVYDLETSLITRALTTFKNHDKNFGILFKGIKGTGKTIIAKIICNTLDIPVILVTKPWNDMGTFINSIQQDIVMFFDEFEKTYNLFDYSQPRADDDDAAQDNISNLLTLMDGVFTSKYKRLFLLTTNKEYLPDAMIARPSRIRYVKNFTDLTLEAIHEILHDVVKNKKLIPDLLLYLQGLEILTVDIVKSVAEEANLYNSADPSLFEIFNVKKLEFYFDIFKVEGTKRKLVGRNEQLPLDDIDEGWSLHVSRKYLGEVIEHDRDKRLIIVNGGAKKPVTYSYEQATGVHVLFSDDV